MRLRFVLVSLATVSTAHLCDTNVQFPILNTNNMFLKHMCRRFSLQIKLHVKLPFLHNINESLKGLLHHVLIEPFCRHPA